MFGHATLVTAGNATHAVMPVANQIWSGACRRNLAAMTVIASDEDDQRRLRSVKINAVAANDAPLPTPTGPSASQGPPQSPVRPSREVSVPTKRSEPPTPNETPSRRERHEQGDADDRERARLAAAARHVADLSRRETHLRQTAERLGLVVGDIETDDGWIRADVAGRILLIGAGGAPPPALLRATAVIWCDSQRQAARFGADGWTTILQLSEVLQFNPVSAEINHPIGPPSP